MIGLIAAMKIRDHFKTRKSKHMRARKELILKNLYAEEENVASDIPNYGELDEVQEEELVLRTKDIIKNLCKEANKEVDGTSLSDGPREWRLKKEKRILLLLKEGKTFEDIFSREPITLVLNKKNQISFNGGITRIRVANKLGIRKVKVIVAKGCS